MVSTGSPVYFATRFISIPSESMAFAVSADFLYIPCSNIIICNENQDCKKKLHIFFEKSFVFLLWQNAMLCGDFFVVKFLGSVSRFKDKKGENKRICSQLTLLTE